MSEVLLSQNEKLRLQFQELGHVGIKGCFDPTLAGLASGRLEQLGRRQSLYIPGELHEIIRGFRMSGTQTELHQVIGTLASQVALLGDNLWAKTPEYHLLHIEMQPGTSGKRHRDSDGYRGAVAITTLEGKSKLLIEDDTCYDLEPGDVAFLDNQRSLVHQGIASDDGKRIGLVVATC